MSLVTPFTPLKLLAHKPSIDAMLAGAVTFPISVEFDASNTCPHDCPFCSFGTKKSGGYRQQNWVTFPTARALALFDELADCGVQSVTFTGGGEPLVHKDIAALFERAAQRMQIGLVTNGFLLKGDAARVIGQKGTFVRVSLDAGTAETHQFTHGTPMPQFHQILSNLRALRETARPGLTIGASFCVMDQNWKEIYQAAKLVKDAGGNYLEVRPTFPTDWRGDGWGQALSDAHVEDAKAEIAHAKAHLNDSAFQVIGMIDRFDRLANPAKTYSACRIGPLTTVIGADGRLWHCCVQRGQDAFCYGSVLDQPFQRVWMTERQRQMQAGINLAKCPRCRYDGLNEVIEQACVADGLHAAFV